MAQSLTQLHGPTDTVSSLSFSPYNPSYLLSSSWDGHLRLFDIATRSVVREFIERAPILDSMFITETIVATASIDGCIRYYDLQSGDLQEESSVHKNAIRRLAYSAAHNILVAGSWDKSISIHRVGDSSTPPVHLQLPEKVFAMSSSKDHLVVAMSNRQVYIYAFSQMEEALRTQNTHLKPLQRRESSLKFMTRTVQCTPTDDPAMAGYVSTSVEGRVAVEFLDPSDASQNRKYAFKCHRQKAKTDTNEDEDVVFPVNAIEFHPLHGTFASGGGDGVISIWDLKAKKRVKQYASINSEIQVLAFSPDGKVLAIGTGSLGSTEDIKEGTIFLRELSESEGRGKA